MITDSLGPGGAERQLYLLCKMLIQHGHDVALISFSFGYYHSPLSNILDTVLVFQRTTRYDIRPLFRVSSAVKSISPDLIHTWGWMSTFSCAAISKYYSFPLVTSVRSGTPPKKNKRASLEIALSSQVISNSEAGLIAYKVPKQKGNVVYNGYDSSRENFSPISYNHRTVIMVARMTPEKDWKCFIDAARSVNNQMEWPVEFVGLGDGPERVKMLEYGKDLLDRGRLQLPGFVNEPLAWMINADIGVLASSDDIHHEGTSNSILEYMACKLPVVCTRSGGNTETVIEGETGLFFNSGDSSMLSSEIISLLTDRKNALRLGLNGYNRINTIYTPENMYRETMSVYRNVINSLH